MKLSWSHKLFFQVNRLVGKSRIFDAQVKFWAEYVVVLFGLWVLLEFWLLSATLRDFLEISLKAGLFLALGLALSFGFAWIWPHHRPKIEFPEIKELITPLSHWKSLPSDHAFVAWALVAMLWHYASPNLGLQIISVLVAVGICMARVLAGVHYPRDIVAGTILAWVLSILFFVIL